MVNKIEVLSSNDMNNLVCLLQELSDFQTTERTRAICLAAADELAEFRKKKVA